MCKEDLKQRTKSFASAVIRYYVKLPKEREEVRVLGKQLLRSGTSVAANYREASRARSPAEFISKVEQCAQEADESLLWLELLWDDCGIQTSSAGELRKETNELIAIFVTMSKNTKMRLNNER
jgi:four helix bundle protein